MKYLIGVLFSLLLISICISIKLEIEIADYITSGNNYAVISALPLHTTNSTTRQLKIAATGPLTNLSYWISPANANRNPNDEQYWKDQSKPHTLNLKKGWIWLQESLPDGSYLIDITTPYQGLVEHLDIKDGKQSIWITREGVEIYSTHGMVTEVDVD